MEYSVKDANSKTTEKQNTQELWDTVKNTNLAEVRLLPLSLGIIGIEEKEETQAKGTENVFNKTIKENFPNLKKEMPIKMQEACRTPNIQDQKRNSL